MEKSVAIVTGASQGIGRSTAIRLARDFSALVLVARDRANLEGTAEAVKAVGAKALVIDSDLSQPEAAKSVLDPALAAFDRIDALLNIAGAVSQIDLFEMTDAQWEAGLALKLHGARRLTIAAWPALTTAKGAVVLMSGNSALFPKAPYAAVGTTAYFPKEAGIARYGEPEEIAELMAFLVSPGARWMTGSTLRMDGGEVKSI